MPSSDAASAPIATALVCAAALGTAAWAGHRALASSSLHPSKKSATPGSAAKVAVDALPPGAFDVVVVGAGPAGSTAAYYLAKGGARVALLEKERFPRDKPCHGALAAPAASVLKDMGVLADLHGTVLAVASADSAPARGLHVKRWALDAALAAAASKAGADLRQSFEVSGLASSFDAAAGMWTIRSTRSSLAGGGGNGRSSNGGGSGGSGRLSSSGGGGGGGSCEVATGNEGGSIAARLLILADGAASKVGAELGFAAPVRANGERGSEGGEEAATPSPTDADAASAAPMQRVASIGIPRSHGDHWLIVGEAAGHAEAQPKAKQGREESEEDEKLVAYHGIHTAMVGAKLAAEAALSMRARGDFSSASTRLYEKAWRREFGSSFVDAWPRAVRRAVESRSDLVEACSSELRRWSQLLFSRVAPSLPSSSDAADGLKAKVILSAEAAKTALQSAAAAAAAAIVAARSGGAAAASRLRSLSGDGGKESSSSEEEPIAEAATASVEVSISSSASSPVGKGGGNHARALASAVAEEDEVAAA